MPLKGYKQIEEHTQKIKENCKGTLGKHWKIKNTSNMKGCQNTLGKHWTVSLEKRQNMGNKKGVIFSEKHKENMKLGSKKKWENPVYREKQIKLILKGSHTSPNKCETFLNNLLQRLLPNQYDYVGDGKFIISGKCPDFINIKKRKLIELYGDYWHRNDNPQDRIDYFKNFRFDTLVIWESELKDLGAVRKKIINYNKHN